MYYIIFAIITLLPCPTLGLVDCLVACTKCQAQEEEYPGTLEVYCAMCRECTDRRREQRLLEHPEREQQVYNLESYAEECPTPPPCETDIDDMPPPYTLGHKLRVTTTTTSTTTTTTTTTTTRRPCPPVKGCKKLPPPRPRCYYPCLPACPCPYPQPYPTPAPHKLAGTTTTSKNTGFIYVYIGVPRDVLQKSNQRDVLRSLLQ